ncbi:MAG: PHP domain-containing protein [Candidatus Sumerlaeaceae bacterium]|nr:PHP domain-containing protein [Candidatus Sumerlaeaceae bacterium]
MRLCDLHMHSTQSDGTLTPRQLVELAKTKNLEAIAVTDHDTLAGIEEARTAGAELGIRVLSGVEISVEYNSRTVHMLGYCFDRGAARLKKGLDEILGGRHERNLKIVSKLNALGVKVTYEEIAAEAGGKVVGRPHFAAVIVRKGYAADKQEVFNKYLARGAAAYEERLRFSPEDSVAMIRDAGGVAVLAHPKLVHLAEGETIEDVVKGLKSAGLGGIECVYSLHTPEETAHYLDLAKKYDLVPTGGSDFHGGNKPEIEMGTGLGSLAVPLEFADDLERLAESAA